MIKLKKIVKVNLPNPAPARLKTEHSKIEYSWIGCMCAFSFESDTNQFVYGVLKEIEVLGELECVLYKLDGGIWYDCCRPARKDEIKFWEDKK